jgi:hypothetical protein
MLWVYDIPNSLFGALTVGVVVLFALLGLALTHKSLGRYNTDQVEANSLVSAFFSGSVGLYGITLGLISVGAWQNYKDVETSAGLEAASIAALYRDLSSYPAPHNATSSRKHGRNSDAVRSHAAAPNGSRSCRCRCTRLSQRPRASRLCTKKRSASSTISSSCVASGCRA